MKQSRTRLFTSLVRGLLRGRRRKPVAMETYLKCIPTIRKLIDTHRLGINLKERLVVVDVSVHLAFLPTGTSAYAYRQADKRYAAFFDKVVAYMNFKLGELQKPLFDATKEPLSFLVTQKETVMWENGLPVPTHLQVREKTLFVGAYRNGVVDYKEFENNGQQ